MALILSHTDVQRCLTMREAIDAMRIAFSALNAGQAQAPQRLAVNLAKQGDALLGEDCPPIRRAASASEALSGASLVACATTATAPLFHRRDAAPGAHINAIGAFTPEMCEVDPETLAQARIVVDQREAALVEAGDLLQALAAGQVPGPGTWIERGELVRGLQPGRRRNNSL